MPRSTAELLPSFSLFSRSTGYQTRISGSGQKANGRAVLGSTLQRAARASPLMLVCVLCPVPVEAWKPSRRWLRRSEIGIPHSLRFILETFPKGLVDSANFCPDPCMRLLVSLVRRKGPMTCRPEQNRGRKGLTGCSARSTTHGRSVRSTQTSANCRLSAVRTEDRRIPARLYS